MKLFKVYYSGSWLGGVAIVFAESTTDAIAKVREHHNTVNFTMVTAIEVEEREGIIYNDNGDY